MLKRHQISDRYFKGYHITSELASTPSSRIFLAESITLPRQYAAIKWLHTISMDSSAELESFLQEVYFLKQLQHPHILPILQAGLDGKTPYIITEYAPLGSLAQRLKQQPIFPLEVVLSIIGQAGRALSYAHQRSIIHYDLKPSNIVFDAQNQARVTDFTLASIHASFQPGSKVTNTYMAPEARLGIITKEGDQFALACIAYEMLTGQQPDPDAHKQPSFPSLYPHPAIPASVEQAILRALSAQPEQRYASIEVFLQELGVSLPSSASMTVAMSASSNDTPTATTTREKHTPPVDTLMTRPLAAVTALPQTITARLTALRKDYRPKDAAPTTVAPGINASPIASRLTNKRAALLAVVCLFIFCSLFALLSTGLRPGPVNNELKTVATPVATSTTATQPVPTATKMPRPSPTATTPLPTPTPTQPVVVVQPTPTTPPPAPQPTEAAGPLIQGTIQLTDQEFGPKSCVQRYYWLYICTTQLKLDASAGGVQSWYAYSQEVGARFQPSSGTIAPGESVTITINVYASCKHKGKFIFVSSQTKLEASWSCGR